MNMAGELACPMQNGLTPQSALERHFGFRKFLDGQEQVIRSVLDGNDTLVVLPTGGGKSLCYQLPALLLDGITIVVSPLIALMKDQVERLSSRGIPAAFINSSLKDSEQSDRIARMIRGEFRLVYIAPERFKSARFVAATAPLRIARFAVDEAHCISQWGHDFRPDYLRLKHALNAMGRPPVIALTATATPEVRADIIAQLALEQSGRRPPNIFVTGFARHNLAFIVTPVRNKREKTERMLSAIHAWKTGIVYCATRKNVERCSRELRELGVKCVAYHGGLTDDERTRAQTRFMSGTVPVAVATNAFGMGIDRADLRFILHYDIPGSVEAYYQEAGRAGRDGEPAQCELLFNYADTRTQEFFIEGSNPTRAVIADTYKTIMRLCETGPIQMPISEIAKKTMLAGHNDMTVASALHLLERAGFISRGYAPGKRIYTTALITPVKPLKSLEIDYERLDAKRERDDLKLRRMIDYADSPDCRQHYILNYFGDTDAERHRVCGRCDLCLARHAKREETRLPTEEETIIIQKVLCCVARLKGRFGRGRVTQTLVGSRAREVLEAGLDRQSTYGLLANEGADFTWNLIDALIAADCIAVNGEKYPIITLTPLGYEVARGKKNVPLTMPSRKPIKNGTARGKTRKKNADAVPEDFPDNGQSAKVFECLKEWRRQKAAAMGGVPAYIVYPDSTLKQLALLLPRTPEELQLVTGIGPVKARQFGSETLEIIRNAIQR